MKNNDNKKIHRTMIGGQAVIEGVMMRGVDKTALAVRKPDGDISLEVWNTSRHDRNSILRLPIIRGVINFVEMLVFGYKTISKSAEIAELAPAEGNPGKLSDTSSSVPEAASAESKSVVEGTTAEGNPGKPSETASSVPEAAPAEGKSVVEGTTAEGNPGKPSETASSVSEAAPAEGKADGTTAEGKPAEGTNTEENPEKSSDTDKNESGGDKGMSVATALSMIAGLVIAILLFAVLPTLIIGKTDRFVHWGSMSTIAEGVIKIAIFIGYLALIARMKDIQRVYQYHGAEHKTIYCYEHGDELTPENARKYTRFHPRCGTSFLLIVLIISIIVFSFVTWKTLWLRILLKLLLLPLVVGISYEIIKFAGRHDNSVMRFLLAPGLWLQRLTTREPDDSQLEVAIKALKAVIPDNPEDDLW
ncbi:DUF1385 domain-containing protein [[Clostridium] cellulosi]